jgi:hypothetical protein
LYGVHHRQIGEALLRSWRFPERIVACQQSFAFRENLPGLSELARVCAIAGELSAFICEPQADLGEVFDNVEAFFGLSKSVATEAVGAAMEHVSEIAELFEVEIDGARDVIELMEKANRALTSLASNVLEYTTIQSPLFSDIPPELSRTQNASAGPREGVSHEIRNRLSFVGRFARRLARTIDPASREGTYVRVIMSETERLEQALHGTGQAPR